MSEQKQSDGREQNAASPVEDWEAKGIFKKDKSGAEARHDIAGDLTGAGGDPAEGKRN